MSENLSSMCQCPGLEKGPFFRCSVGFINQNCKKNGPVRDYHDSYKSRTTQLPSISMPTCCLIKIISGVKRIDEEWTLARDPVHVVGGCWNEL